MEFPTEIIVEILTRLPVKPLLRCKSVSKSWYSLIKSPNFTKFHLCQTLISDTHRHLLLSSTTLSTASLSSTSFSLSSFSPLPQHPLLPAPKPDTLNYFPDPPGVELLGSCDGILSISNASKNVVYLYNPSTRTSKQLPASYVSYPEDYVVFGFGYDSLNDDYKVLRIIQCRESYCHVKFYNEARVYSLREDSWRWVRDMPYYLLYKEFHGVLVEGGLHFVVAEMEGGVKEKRIARFDVRDEGYSLIEGPDYGDDDGGVKLVLGEMKGCLGVMVDFGTGICAELWVMKEYGKKESWVRVVSLEISPWFKDVKPVTCSSDGGRVLLLIDHCEVQWCDLRTAEKRVRLRKSFEPVDEPFNAGVFVDSVISLDDWVNSPRKVEKKNDLDNFLSVGFKLRL